MENMKKRKISSGDAVKSYDVDPLFYSKLYKIPASIFAVKEGVPLKKQPIFVCQRDDLVVGVWKGMIQRNISSCPVVLKDAKHTYHGFIDCADILKYIMNKFPIGAETGSFFDLASRHKELAELTVREIMKWPLSKKNPFHPISAKTSALSAMEILAKERGVHRLPVLNEHREIVNLITNTQVIEFLTNHVEILGEKKDKPINECKQFFGSVVSAFENEKAGEAFQRMLAEDITGLCVKNDSGRLVGNLSVRDLKLIGADAQLWTRLAQTLVNFVPKLRHEFQEKHGRPQRVRCLTGDETVFDALNMMNSNNIHRVFIVDAKGTKGVVGHISICDLLAEIMS